MITDPQAGSTQDTSNQPHYRSLPAGSGNMNARKLFFRVTAKIHKCLHALDLLSKLLHPDFHTLLLEISLSGWIFDQGKQPAFCLAERINDLRYGFLMWRLIFHGVDYTMIQIPIQPPHSTSYQIFSKPIDKKRTHGRAFFNSNNPEVSMVQVSMYRTVERWMPDW